MGIDCLTHFCLLTHSQLNHLILLVGINGSIRVQSLFFHMSLSLLQGISYLLRIKIQDSFIKIKHFIINKWAIRQCKLIHTRKYLIWVLNSYLLVTHFS